MTDSPDEPENIQDLLVAYAPRVYGLLLRMVGRRDVAEDLMQETMLRAFRGRESYQPVGKFRAWIFRIAVNRARDWIRQQQRRAPVPDDPRPATDAPVDAPAIARERAGYVEQALARLSETDREVLLMRYYGDMTFKDIAQATAEPLGTVLARAHRALKKLGGMIPEDSR
ncbi:MAG: RNA polymerase sigma factor [Planctomycetota bacterium]|nr:RNA polymerase sigma factor [Planctomycetota bacterium]